MTEWTLERYRDEIQRFKDTGYNNWVGCISYGGYIARVVEVESEQS